jgi:hypothetical protein
LRFAGAEVSVPLTGERLRLMMKIFNELGSLVEHLWRARHYSEQEFPAIAFQALAEIDLAGKGVTPWEIIRWVHGEPQLPRQLDIDGSFGNPPITLYCGPRFYIDIYFWLDGTTEVHQHSFAGAFQVLTGSSIHSEYSFRQHRAINEHLHIGDVVFERAELLTEKDVRKIMPSREHIHSLFHLDRPSATITVRTFGMPSAQPQYSYRKPFIAIDPFFKEPTLIRKLQTVAMLLDLQTPAHDQMIGELLRTSDFHSTFLILDLARNRLSGSQFEQTLNISRSRDRFDELLNQARDTHGDLADCLLPVIEEQNRVNDIVRRRQFITTPEHRFFLALLLNVPSRVKLQELVKERFPDKDALDTVLDWVMDLSTTRVWGSNEPNVLGIADFDDDYLFVLECLLKDFSPAQMNEAITAQYPADYGHKLAEKAPAVIEALRSSVLFKSILAA